MKQRLLIELDAIMDTRLATIARLSPEAAKRMVSNKAYYTRSSDQFDLIDSTINMNAYQELYKKRDYLTLMGSRPTAMVLLIAEHVRDLERRLYRGEPDITAFAVDVNTYPYDLTDVEIAAVLEAVKKICNITVAVEHVYIPPDKLTTSYINTCHWAGIYMYNFMDWDDNYLSKCETPPESAAGVTIYMPEIVRDIAEINSDKTIIPNSGKRLHPHHAVAILLCETISIEALDAKLFSIIQL